MKKRNRLLEKLLENEIIDSLTFDLSKAEGLPQKPFPLPQIAPHLLQKVSNSHTGKRVETRDFRSKQILLLKTTTIN